MQESLIVTMFHVLKGSVDFIVAHQYAAKQD